MGNCWSSREEKLNKIQNKVENIHNIVNNHPNLTQKNIDHLQGHLVKLEKEANAINHEANKNQIENINSKIKIISETLHSKHNKAQDKLNSSTSNSSHDPSNRKAEIHVIESYPRQANLPQNFENYFKSVLEYLNGEVTNDGSRLEQLKELGEIKGTVTEISSKLVTIPDPEDQLKLCTLVKDIIEGISEKSRENTNEIVKNQNCLLKVVLEFLKIKTTDSNTSGDEVKNKLQILNNFINNIPNEDGFSTQKQYILKTITEYLLGHSFNPSTVNNLHNTDGDEFTEVKNDVQPEKEENQVLVNVIPTLKLVVENKELHLQFSSLSLENNLNFIDEEYSVEVRDEVQNEIRETAGILPTDSVSLSIPVEDMNVEYVKNQQEIEERKAENESSGEVNEEKEVLLNLKSHEDVFVSHCNYKEGEKKGEGEKKDEKEKNDEEENKEDENHSEERVKEKGKEKEEKSLNIYKFESIPSQIDRNEKYIENDKQQQYIDELSDINNIFNRLKPEIVSFVGSESDPKYFELDENCMRLILRLDRIKFERDSEIHIEKVSLLKEVLRYGEVLSEKAKGEDKERFPVERKNLGRNRPSSHFNFSEKHLINSTRIA